MTMIYAQCEFMNLIKRAFTGTHLSPNYQVNPHPINLSEHPISKVCDIAMNGGGRARDAYGIISTNSNATSTTSAGILSSR